jgi:hypothetical protein
VCFDGAQCQSKFHCFAKLVVEVEAHRYASLCSTPPPPTLATRSSDSLSTSPTQVRRADGGGAAAVRVRRDGGGHDDRVAHGPAVRLHAARHEDAAGEAERRERREGLAQDVGAVQLLTARSASSATLSQTQTQVRLLTACTSSLTNRRGSSSTTPTSSAGRLRASSRRCSKGATTA